MLNLGSGNDTYGDIRVDLYPTESTTDSYNIEDGIRLPDESVDEVYTKNLFEHLRNPGYFLEEVSRVLKPGGKLILITDNAAYIPFYRYGSVHLNHYKPHGEDKHYAVFTISHINNFIIAAGFSLMSINLVDSVSGSFGKGYKYAPILRKRTYRIVFRLFNLLRLSKSLAHFTYSSIKVEASKPIS